MYHVQSDQYLQDFHIHQKAMLHLRKTQNTYGGVHMSTSAFLRLPQVLAIVPVSKSSWWKGCKTGRYPKPVKLGRARPHGGRKTLPLWWPARQSGHHGSWSLRPAMRWLKHPSGISRSPAMSEVRDVLGIAGYGAVWLRWSASPKPGMAVKSHNFVFRSGNGGILVVFPKEIRCF